MEHLEQRKFDEMPTIVKANEYSMSLVLLLDTSCTMEVDNKIGQLNEGVNRFKEEVCEVGYK